MGAREVRLVMGMPVEVDLRDDASSRDLVEAVFDWFEFVDQTFSTYRDSSEISRINSGVLDSSQVSRYVAEVLQTCDRLKVETNGYFDPTHLPLPHPVTGASGQPVTVGLDPSGFVKGWAVAKASKIIADAGVTNYCVNAGGDIVVSGGALPDPVWRLGIQHPLELDKVAAVLELTHTSIATSGEYRRGRHISDPYTNSPAQGVLSVTIIGPDLGVADAYATAAFAMADNGPRWTMSLAPYEAMTILSNGLVLTTPGFPPRL